MSCFTYEDVGATRDGGVPCPPGFRPLHERTRLGEGRAVFQRASEALMSWEMHRELGLGITASADRAAPGVDVTVTLAGLIKAPCRIVWATEESRLTGWAYGTLDGHPESGEEAFRINRTGDGTVWLTVTGFSRPNRWYAKAAGAATRGFQHAYARRCGTVMRRICAEYDEA